MIRLSLLLLLLVPSLVCAQIPPNHFFWEKKTSTQSTPVDVGNPAGVLFGGTGQSSYTDGQLLIGNSSGNGLSKATLTAGGNITITNGPGSITIASTPGGSSYTFGAGLTNTGGTITVGGGQVTNAMLAGSIDLTAKVTGVLPKANGGTGTASPGLVAGTNITITGGWPNQTIDASGGLTHLIDGSGDGNLLQNADGLTNSIASGHADFAGGLNSSVTSGDWCFVWGIFARATSQGSIALGSNTMAAGYRSVAIGNGAVTSGTYSISLGTCSNNIDSTIFAGFPFYALAGIVGSTDGSDAASGDWGEVTESTPSPGYVPLTSGVAQNAVSLNLSPGYWEISGNLNYAFAVGTTGGQCEAGIGTSSASITEDGKESYSYLNLDGSGTAATSISLATRKVNLTTITTVYLVGKATFLASGTVPSMQGFIEAHRIR